MAYLINKRHIFLHIPKTGGTWIEHIVKNSELNIRKIGFNKHVTYDYVCANLNFDYDNSHIFRRILPRVQRHKFNYFCVLRNPLTWYESLFNHLIRFNFKKFGSPGDNFHWHIWSKLSELNADNFNGFMNQLMQISPGFASSTFNAYMLNSNAVYLKKENLRIDLLKLSRMFNLAINEELIFSSEEMNISNKTPIFWDEKIYKKVLIYDKSTFDKYNYETKNIVQIR